MSIETNIVQLMKAIFWELKMHLSIITKTIVTLKKPWLVKTIVTLYHQGKKILINHNQRSKQNEILELRS